MEKDPRSPNNENTMEKTVECLAENLEEQSSMHITPDSIKQKEIFSLWINMFFNKPKKDSF